MRNKIPCQALKGMSSILLQGLSVHKGRSLRESRHLESSILKCSHVPRRLFHASRRCFPEQQRSTLKKFKVLWSKGGGRGKLHCLGYKKNKDKRCKKKKRDLQEVQISSFCSILTPRSSDSALFWSKRDASSHGLYRSSDPALHALETGTHSDSAAHSNGPRG